MLWPPDSDVVIAIWWPQHIWWPPDNKKYFLQWYQRGCVESRMEARFGTFSANRCDWISISCMRCVELIGYFVRFGHLIFLRISLLKQKTITSKFLTMFSYDCSLRILFLFSNYIVKQYNSIAKLGTFLWATRYLMTRRVSRVLSTTAKLLVMVAWHVHNAARGLGRLAASKQWALPPVSCSPRLAYCTNANREAHLKP